MCLARRLPVLLAVLVALALIAGPLRPAAADELRPLVDALGQGGFDGAERAVGELAATGDPRAARILEALAAGDLAVRRADGRVVLGQREGRDLVASDPLTGEALGTLGAREVERIRVNNQLRRAVRAAMAGLTLGSPDPRVRRSAAETLFRSRDAESLDALRDALVAETDGRVRRAMERAVAAIVLTGAGPEAERLDAVTTIRSQGGRDGMVLLSQVAAGEGPVAEAAGQAARRMEQELALWGVAQNLVYGLSLASVLLLAAIGLSITFGVMGVINMAHGEMVMLGAYVTFAVQQTLRTAAPELFDYSLAFAVPLAFLTGALIGIVIERTVIRWLYGRPLETLLATWGLSLVLQQAVRSLFGPTNREVSNPTWMSGAFRLGELTITYNRLWIFVFALVVFALLLLIMRRTAFGLQMRAVTQNRQMAAAMGIRTRRVDALTFGLGSGIAGLAGVALSQIDNVSPNLGQSYIIDSFLVVVFGGVGNLWGTLSGALALGVLNKFLEPYAGAVLGKILILVAVILFIQKRPRGLFAQRGRAVET